MLPASPVQDRKDVLEAIRGALRHFGSLEIEGGGLAQVCDSIFEMSIMAISRHRLQYDDKFFFSAQAWMPVVNKEGSGTVLQTKVIPPRQFLHSLL